MRIDFSNLEHGHYSLLEKAIISTLGASDSTNLCISVLNLRVLTGIY